MNLSRLFPLLFSALPVLSSCDKGESLDVEDIKIPTGYALSAGTATGFYNSSIAYDQGASWLSGSYDKRFNTGDRLYDNVKSANENGMGGGLGPVYAGYSCGSCHRNAGRTEPTYWTNFKQGSNDGSGSYGFTSSRIYITRRTGSFFPDYGRVIHDQAIYGVKKAIPDHTDGDITIVLSNINNQVTEVQLCVLDRLRRHVLTFDKIEMQQTNDTVYMNVGERNVSMFNAIQQNYLNTTCANCHGASNRAAAGLYLTEGRSYAAMVGVPSVKIDTLKIVEPGNAEKSLLHIILHQDNVEGISMTHRDLVSEKNEQSILPLIDKWIDNGAKKN